MPPPLILASLSDSAFLDKFNEVTAKVTARRNADHRRIVEMEAVAVRYNGDYVVPIPDVEGETSLPAPAPTLIADAVEGTAMRAATVMPPIEVPAVTGNGVSVDRAKEYAAKRRRFLYAAWDFSALDVLMFRAFRHYTGYASCSFVVLPDFADSRPRIVLRDPLGSYPEPRDPEDVRAPNDAAFVYGKTSTELIRQFPETRTTLERYHANDDSTIWDIFEWCDADETIVGLLGPRQPRWEYSRYAGSETPGLSMPLRRWPNRAGITCVYIPQRVTLDRVMSQVAKMIPQSDLHQKLTALDVVAAERTIFADRYAVGTDGQTPAIISGGGVWQPGTTGKINLLQNVKQVGAMHDGPGPMAQPILDRLERTVAQGVGASPFDRGETYGSLRTGRAIDTLASFSVDPRIHEAHVVMQRALRAINPMVLATAEGYWPNREYRVFSGWAVDKGVVEATPSKHFQKADGGYANAVEYSIPGADITQVTVALGQLLGAKLISHREARIKHPLVTDHDNTQSEIEIETIREAITQAYGSQVIAGGVALEDGVALLAAMERGKSLTDAIRDAIVAAKRRQAEQQTAAPGSLEAQPGLQPEQAMMEQQAVSAGPPQTAPQDPRARARALLEAMGQPAA